MMAGKWLISDFKGEMFGSTFEGHGTNGYDAKKSKYIGTWVDSMSVRIDTLEGTYDEKTKTLTLNSDSEGPDGKPMKMRLETRFNDDANENLHTFHAARRPEGILQDDGDQVHETKVVVRPSAILERANSRTYGGATERRSIERGG